MAALGRAKAAETQRLEGIYRQLLAGSGVELVEGRAGSTARTRARRRPAC